MTGAADRTKELEKILAIEIERAAQLLRENEVLTRKLNKVKMERNALRQYYQKSQKGKKISCNRDNAMVVHSEVDINEFIGESVNTQ